MTQNHNSYSSSSPGYLSIIKIVKWTFLPYFAFQFLQYLSNVSRNPTSFIEYTIWFLEVSGWGYILFGGPFVLIGLTVNYFMSKTYLINIPADTTLYEIVTRPIIMVGNMKLILPEIDENIEILANSEEEF